MLDSEPQIIKHAVKGKASAFGSLYDHYQPAIYRFVLIKVGRREEAEDLTHQVFLSAWQNIKGYEDRGLPFSSWLYQIHFVEEARAHFGLDEKFEIEKVRSAIQKLKPEYQDVLIMRFVEDLAIKDVASALEKSEGAIKLMQHRALKELKEFLT